MNDFKNNRINRKTFDTIFNFKKMDRDCCSIINKYIGGKMSVDYSSNYWSGLNDIVKCEFCDYKDMYNENNFERICCCCNINCCKRCFREEQYEVCNENEDREDWLCYNCGTICEGCEDYVYVDNIRSLLCKDGDWNYRCVNCCNDRCEIKDIIFDFNGESYDKKDCEMNEKNKEECECCNKINENSKECIEGDCEDEECDNFRTEKCDKCKSCKCEECKEELYEDLKKCSEEGEYECKKCSKENSNIYYCNGCNLEFNVINKYIYKLGDEDKYCCGDCINDSMFYM